MSRDIIFQSFGLDGLKPRSRLGTLKFLKMGMSWQYLKVPFKTE